MLRVGATDQEPPTLSQSSMRLSTLLRCDTNQHMKPTQEPFGRFRAHSFLGHSRRRAAASLRRDLPSLPSTAITEACYQRFAGHLLLPW
jgi:hypothetical protein